MPPYIHITVHICIRLYILYRLPSWAIRQVLQSVTSAVPVADDVLFAADGSFAIGITV